MNDERAHARAQRGDPGPGRWQEGPPLHEVLDVDWAVVDDLVADGWPQEDAIRFAQSQPRDGRP